MLKLAGVFSLAIAVLHVVVIAVGAPAYRYFGAGERLARQSEQASLTPALLTAGIAVVFAVWALYAFSGAGLIRRLPLIRLGLVAIGTIYVLRGVLLGPQLAVYLSGAFPQFPVRDLVFSAVSLFVGLLYVLGVARAWRSLAPVRG